MKIKMKKTILLLALIFSSVFAANAQKTNGTTKPVTTLQATLKEFKTEGITWHAITLKSEKFTAYKKMLNDVFGLKPVFEQEGFSLFQFANVSMLELYAPNKVPAYGYNGTVAFGFRVSDIEAATAALMKAGYKVLGDIIRLKEMNYAYVHFTGPDGIVYGLNEQK